MNGRNDPCPCGSGRKYKRCCLERDRAETSRRLAARTAADPFGGIPPGPAPEPRSRPSSRPADASRPAGTSRPNASSRSASGAAGGSGAVGGTNAGSPERLPPAGRERDRLLERVAKLYRMSGETESSPHEAAIALRRCQALMARFGITEADLQSSPFGTTALSSTGSRIPSHALFLAQAVALLHDCIVVRGEGLEFRGYALDTEVARLTFEYLAEAMERSLAYRKRDGGVPAGRAAAFDYRVGYAMSVLERCREIDRERRAAERAAARSGDAEGGRSLIVRKLEAVERECAAGLGHGRRRRVRVRSGDALDAGGADGREVSLSTQIG